MTEQQFEKIKTLLDASAPILSSTELDNTILNAAVQQAELNKQTQAPKQRLNHLSTTLVAWLRELHQHSLAQAAVLSTALTLAVFVGMAQLLKSGQAPSLSASEQTTIEFQTSGPDISKDSMAVRTTPVMPIVEFNMPETQHARDQILANMPLPDIQLLLSDTVLLSTNDRPFAENVISIAMTDIRFMLDNGQLDDARTRYAALKERCAKCALPDSLEALVANSISLSGST